MLRNEMKFIAIAALLLLIAGISNAATTVLCSDTFENGTAGQTINGQPLNNYLGGVPGVNWLAYDDGTNFTWYTQSGVSGSLQQAYSSQHLALANVAMDPNKISRMDVRVQTRNWDPNYIWDSGLFILRNNSDLTYWAAQGVMIRIFTGITELGVSPSLQIMANGTTQIAGVLFNPQDYDSYGYLPFSIVWSGAGTVAKPLHIEIYVKGVLRRSISNITGINGGGNLAGFGGGNGGWFDDFKLSRIDPDIICSDSFENGPYGGALDGVTLDNALGGTVTTTWLDYDSANSWYTQSGVSGTLQQAYNSHHVALANVALNTSSTWQIDVRVQTRDWTGDGTNYESGVFLLRNASDKTYWSSQGVMIRIFTGTVKALWVLGKGGAKDIFFTDLNPSDYDSYGYVPLSVVWKGAGTVASPLTMDLYANGNYKGGVTGITGILGGGNLVGFGGGNAGWFDDFKLRDVTQPPIVPQSPITRGLITEWNADHVATTLANGTAYVEKVIDQSGKGYDAVKGYTPGTKSPDDTYRPTLISNILNGHNVLHFDGSKWMVYWDSDGHGPNWNTGSWTWFTVFKSESAVGEQEVVCTGLYYPANNYYDERGWDTAVRNGRMQTTTWGNPPQDHVYVGEDKPQNFDWNITWGVWDPNHLLTVDGTIDAYFDNVKGTNIAASDTSIPFNSDLTWQGTQIGSRRWYYEPGTSPGTSLFKGDIAEIIIYNVTLNSTERATMYNYLKNKYGLSMTCSRIQARGEGKPADLTGDCYVNFKDLAIFVGNWLICNDPAGCP